MQIAPIDIPQMPAIATVRLNALIWFQKVNKDFVEYCNIIELPGGVWALDLHQMDDGPIDYFFVEFHVNGVLPEGGYKISFAEDGMSVKFKRAIRKVCFAKQHLKAIIKGEYSNSHSLVTAVDQTADHMRRERVEESGDYYWSADQVVYLAARCTGTPNFGYKEYPTGNSVQGHKQFNCVCTCRVQLADQRTNIMSNVHREVVNMLDLPSSQSSNDSPPHYPCNKCDGVMKSPDAY
jgi:hypothetical protein